MISGSMNKQAADKRSDYENATNHDVCTVHVLCQRKFISYPVAQEAAENIESMIGELFKSCLSLQQQIYLREAVETSPTSQGRK